MILNDVQSKINETNVAAYEKPDSIEQLGELISKHSKNGSKICPSGALHSMGGQQFITDGIVISNKYFQKIKNLNPISKSVHVGSGVTWPMLNEWLNSTQETKQTPLSIIQKQTGADELSLGGAISSNIHGRVLGRKPIVDDVISFDITTPGGQHLHCDRNNNSDLFSLAIGGYGLFGFIDSIQLKLTERQRLVREVSEISIEEVIPLLESKISEGAKFGDFQYMTDESSPDFLSKGILSVYSPIENAHIPTREGVGLSKDDWKNLYLLAHTDKGKAYTEYLTRYLQTNGQVYWSDEHQFSPYLPDAEGMLNKFLGWDVYKTLMISELYVPKENFVPFMRSVKKALATTGANLIYGTVRLIKKESESFLRWAKKDYACVIFNLLIEHDHEGLKKAKTRFRALIDEALSNNGNFYLTYHKWASKEQVKTGYPEVEDFLQAKDTRDLQNLFRSNWHQHYKKLFS